MFGKIPLAWLQLTKEKSRLLVAIAGISFADILMFMQLGFKDALLSSNTLIHQKLRADLVLISPKSEALPSMQTFSWRRLYQALGFEGVQSVGSLYIGLISWKTPEDMSDRHKPICLPNSENTENCKQPRRERSIFVLGFTPKENAFNIPELDKNLEKIKLPDVVLFDRAARPEFGPIAQQFDQGQVVSTEVGGRRIKVGGLFTLGASFAADGNLITSDLNFLRLFKERNLGEIDVGLIYLKPSADPQTVKANLIKKLPEDVKVLTHQEFIEFERKYWQETTPIGFVFTLGVIMGFIFGMVIVYQILYTDVADHLPEYATLKAMGYADVYFYGVVLQEAVILAVLGFLPGFCLCNFFLYNFVIQATKLPILMTLNRAVMVLVLTIMMCLVSGMVAMRKLQAADPADIF